MPELFDVDEPRQPRRLVLPSLPVPDGRSTEARRQREAREVSERLRQANTRPKDLTTVRQRMALTPTGTPEYMALAREAEELERQAGSQAAGFGAVASALPHPPFQPQAGWKTAGLGPITAAAGGALRAAAETPAAQAIGSFARGRPYEPRPPTFQPQTTAEAVGAMVPSFISPPYQSPEELAREPGWSQAAMALTPVISGAGATLPQVMANVRAGQYAAGRGLQRGAGAVGREAVRELTPGPGGLVPGSPGFAKVPKGGKAPAGFIPDEGLLNRFEEAVRARDAAFQKFGFESKEANAAREVVRQAKANLEQAGKPAPAPPSPIVPKVAKPPSPVATKSGLIREQKARNELAKLQPEVQDIWEEVTIRGGTEGGILRAKIEGFPDLVERVRALAVKEADLLREVKRGLQEQGHMDDAAIDALIQKNDPSLVDPWDRTQKWGGKTPSPVATKVAEAPSPIAAKAPPVASPTQVVQSPRPAAEVPAGIPEAAGRVTAPQAATQPPPLPSGAVGPPVEPPKPPVAQAASPQEWYAQDLGGQPATELPLTPPPFQAIGGAPVYPAGKQELGLVPVQRALAKRPEFVLGEEGVGGPPAVIPPATTGAGGGAGELGRIRTALQTPAKPPIDWGGLYLKAQERLNDATFGLRRMQSRAARTANIQPGSAQDIKSGLNTGPGAANAGYTRYRLAVSEAAKAAPGAQVSDIEVVLFAEHGKDILREKGAARVLPGGVNTAAGLDQALAALEREVGPEKYQQVRKAAQIIRDTYARERERLIAEGFISPELGGWLGIHYPWYNPLRYLEYVDEQAAKGLAARPMSVTESGLRRLGDVGSEDAILHPMGALGQQLIRNEVRIRKNKLAKGIISVALQDPSLGVTKRAGPFPPGDIPGTISFFENGERLVYDVPQWMAWETSVLNRGMAHPVVAFVGALNGVSKAAFTTFSPMFTAANIANDMIPAFVRGGVLPTETAAQIARSLKPLEQDVLRQAFALSGAKQTRFYGKDAEALAKAVGASGGTVIGKHTDLSKLLLDVIPTGGEIGEQAPRTVAFRKYLDKYLPAWRKMTAEQIAATPQARAGASEAVEATINFHRGGYWVQSANPFVIFINAAMEGSKLPYRALAESSRARWTTAGIGAGVMGLTAYNMTYPEYFDVPDNVRRGSVMVMLPSRRKDEQGNPIPRYVTIIPNTREWAMFFGTLSYGMEKVFKDSPESFWDFARVMIPQVSPVTNMPIPQPLLEGVQQVTNYDIYRGRPIVSQAQAQAPAAEQTGPYVSSTVQKLASKSGLSPVRVQHVLDTLFGGAGAAALSVTDQAVGVKNPRGLALKLEYEQLSQDERPKWLAKHSAADKSALNAAMRQTGTNIPIVSPIVGRFYRERGGQLEQDKWDRLRKGTAAQEQLNDLPELKRLGIRFTGVGTQVNNRELTLEQRLDYQALASELALEAVVKTTQGAYYDRKTEDGKKKALQTAMDGARQKARQQLKLGQGASPQEQAPIAPGWQPPVVPGWEKATPSAAPTVAPRLPPIYPQSGPRGKAYDQMMGIR